MKKFLTLLMAVAMILSAIPFTLLTPMSVSADGGETSFHITAPSDGSTVRGDRDVTIRWTGYPGAVKTAVTVKDMDTGARPLEIHVTGTSYTVKADTVFTESHRYKVYCAALDSSGRVLAGEAAWESIYVTCEYPDNSDNIQPELLPSPSLTSPKLTVKYNDEVGCYVGISSKVISTDEDFTIRWEDVGGEESSVSAIILKGEPDPGYSESKLVQLAHKDHTTKNKYTFDQEELEGYGGRWLKVAIQVLNDDGGFSLMSMVYFRLESVEEDDGEDEDVEPDKENIIIDGVDIGYKVGDYFTKNGKACNGCHSDKTISCVDNGSKCNCLRYVEIDGRQVDLMAVQCYGFARYIQMTLFGEHDGMSGSDFSKRLTGTKATVEALKTVAAPGTHIRTASSVKGYAHSLVIADFTSTEVTVVDCNNKGTCNVDLRVMTWSSLVSLINGYGGIEYVAVHGEADEPDPTPTPTPTPVGTLALSVGVVSATPGVVSATPGETVRVPLSVTTNPGCGYIRLRITADLPVTVTNGNLFPHMSVGTTAIFYADTSDVKKTGDLAYLTVTIPEDAADGQAYSIKVEGLECFNMAEESLKVTGATGQVKADAVVRFDVTGDGEVSGQDLIRLVSFLAEQDPDSGVSPVTISRKGADANGDGQVRGDDVIALVKFLASM